ncbi:MAG TPA: threonine synthase [Bacteroidales bacterium]|nr:threonine synthase [Bacteroidales bacterium]HPO65942.1 threonine synthase [Bacteroidales bacterium]
MARIQYYSTNLKSEKVSFREALIRGQAPDRGLYMPDQIPVLTPDQIESFAGKSYPEIAEIILKLYVNDDISQDDLSRLVRDAYNFEIPLENVYDRIHVMRLDRGPTASFKDFAARMMGRLMQYFLKLENRRMLILTATSGDTGSAIANAFYGLDNIEVVILFPEKEVTDRQRKQMTTLNQNITVLAIDGKFDDCQALVKRAFADEDLSFLPLSSANSINIGRLIPQSIYYFWAWSQLANNIDDKIIFSVPSGNFGNLMGGIIARHMGLPVERFVVSTNENDEVPVYFAKGSYQPLIPSRNCISSAMNVGHPSNMARIVALYGGIMDEKGNISKQPDIDRLKKDLWPVSITDSQTRETIKNAYEKYRLLLEPHGAVAWAGLHRFFEAHPELYTPFQLCVTLETAHPAKFPQEIEHILGIQPDLPESMSHLDEKIEHMIPMSNRYEDFKNYLLKRK